MALIVEDGTGKTDSNGYITVAELKSYWSTRGITLSQTDEVLGTWIILATDYIDSNYCFYGYEPNDTQALVWPRTAFYDSRGRSVEEGTIPQSLKDACAFLAKQSSGATLNANVTTGISSKSVGSVSVSYSGSSQSSIKQYPTADKLLSGISYKAGSFVTRL